MCDINPGDTYVTCIAVVSARAKDDVVTCIAVIPARAPSPVDVVARVAVIAAWANSVVHGWTSKHVCQHTFCLCNIGSTHYAHFNMFSHNKSIFTYILYFYLETFTCTASTAIYRNVECPPIIM